MVMVIYTSNNPKRLPGKRNDPNKSQIEILRFVHSKLNGVTESDIRDFAETPILNISVPKNVKNHLKTLKNKNFLSNIFEEGVSNTWYSQVYTKINNDFKKCDLPELKENDKKLIDFLVKYSNNFMDIILSQDFCKLYRESQKMQMKEFTLIVSLIAKNIGSHPVTIEPPFLLKIAHLCIGMDLLLGSVDIDTPEFWEAYERALLCVTDAESVKNCIDDTKKVKMLKPLMDETAKNFNKRF